MPAKKKSKNKVIAKKSEVVPDAAQLLGDIRTLIDEGRTTVARAVNAGLVLMNWSIGDRIRREILGERRAKYGEQIVSTLSEIDHQWIRVQPTEQLQHGGTAECPDRFANCLQIGLVAFHLIDQR